MYFLNKLNKHYDIVYVTNVTHMKTLRSAKSAVVLITILGSKLSTVAIALLFAAWKHQVKDYEQF